MDTFYLPILIAAAVALFIWGIAMAIKGIINTEKRKLQTRLRDEAQRSNGGGGSQLPLSVTRNTEVAGAARMLVKFSPLEGLHRLVVQAYPNMTVAHFVILAGAAALLMVGMASLMTSNTMIAGVAAVL